MAQTFYVFVVLCTPSSADRLISGLVHAAYSVQGLDEKGTTLHPGELSALLTLQVAPKKEITGDQRR